jgi:hypothetical protein
MIHQNRVLDTLGRWGWPESTEVKLKGKMSTDDYSAVDEASAPPRERSAKFTSRWAIPRVEPQEKPAPTKRRRQINNIVLLFIIHVFRQTKKSLFLRRLRVKYRATAKR